MDMNVGGKRDPALREVKHNLATAERSCCGLQDEEYDGDHFVVFVVKVGRGTRLRCPHLHLYLYLRQRLN
jgi:hypothetical protein